jgi:uncharacterized HAD superfamily protein
MVPDIANAHVFALTILYKEELPKYKGRVKAQLSGKIRDKMRNDSLIRAVIDHHFGAEAVLEITDFRRKLHKEFGFWIPDDEFQNLLTIADIADYYLRQTINIVTRHAVYTR